MPYFGISLPIHIESVCFCLRMQSQRHKNLIQLGQIFTCGIPFQFFSITWKHCLRKLPCHPFLPEGKSYRMTSSSPSSLRGSARSSTLATPTFQPSTSTTGTSRCKMKTAITSMWVLGFLLCSLISEGRCLVNTWKSCASWNNVVRWIIKIGGELVLTINILTIFTVMIRSLAIFITVVAIIVVSFLF